MPPLFCPELMFSRLRSEAGAISAVGAVVGVILMGGIAVSSAAYAIPLAQDSAAQQNTSQIGTAQGLARIMDGHYTDLDGLESGGYLPAYRDASGPRRFDAGMGKNGSCFVAVSRSGTGNFFFTTDLIPDPEPLRPDTETGCLSESQVRAMAASLDAAAGEST